MTRQVFGADTASLTYANGEFVGSQLCTFWTAQTGGTQITDLLDASSNPITTVTSNPDATLPLFFGPNNGAYSMWVFAGGGERLKIYGDLTAGVGSPSTYPLTFQIQGTLSHPLTGGVQFPMRKAGTIDSVQGTLLSAATGTTSTPITGAAVVCDINKNGTTIFGTQPLRPTFAASSLVSSQFTGMTVTTFAASDLIGLDVDFSGSTAPGTWLLMNVWVTETP